MMDGRSRGTATTAVNSTTELNPLPFQTLMKKKKERVGQS